MILRGAQSKALVVFLPLVIATMGVVHALHLSMDRLELEHDDSVSIVLPSPEALGWLSLGYDSVMADYYWLRAIGYFGDNRMESKGFPDFLPLLERVISLDPYFAEAYFFGGTALTLIPDQIEASFAVLERGLEYRSDDWRLHYVLGFNAYFYRHEFVRAAQLFAEAAKDPRCPSMIGPLAAKLASEGGEPAVGIQIIDGLLAAASHSDSIRLQYEERRRLLVLEVELLGLRKAARIYHKRLGYPPQNFETLFRLGLITRVPGQDPLGGKYWIDQEGVVQTSSEAMRLRLSDKAREFLR